MRRPEPEGPPLPAPPAPEKALICTPRRPRTWRESPQAGACADAAGDQPVLKHPKRLFHTQRRSLTGPGSQAPRPSRGPVRALLCLRLKEKRPRPWTGATGTIERRDGRVRRTRTPAPRWAGLACACERPAASLAASLASRSRLGLAAPGIRRGNTSPAPPCGASRSPAPSADCEFAPRREPQGRTPGGLSIRISGRSYVSEPRSRATGPSSRFRLGTHSTRHGGRWGPAGGGPGVHCDRGTGWPTVRSAGAPSVISL